MLVRVECVRDLGEQAHVREPHTVAGDRVETARQLLELRARFLELPGLDAHPCRGRDETRLVRVLGRERIEHVREPVELAPLPRDEQRLHGVGDAGGARADLRADAPRLFAVHRRFVDPAAYLRAHRLVEAGVPLSPGLTARERAVHHLRHRRVRLRQPAALEQVADPPHLGLHRERPTERAQLVVELQPIREGLGTRERSVADRQRHRDRRPVAGLPRERQRVRR